MPKISRLGQVGFNVEAVIGEEETLAAADYAGVHTDVEWEYVITNEERAARRPTLSRIPHAKGPRRFMARITEELLGGGASTAPRWTRLLRAAGFAQAALKIVDLDSISGTFALGEIFGNNASQGSATKTGRVVAIIDDDIVYLPLTGTFAGTDNITAYTSGATATVNGSPADAGFAYTPQTAGDGVDNASLTVDIRDNGQRHTGVAMRSASAGLVFEHERTPKITVELEGLPILDEDDSPVEAGNVASVPALGSPAAAVRSVAMSLGSAGGALTPVAPRVEYRIATPLSPRPTIGDDDIASSGYKDPVIADRTVTASIEPEMVSDSVHPMIQQHLRADDFAISSDFGDAGGAHGRVLVYAPAAQATGNARRGERDNLVTLPHELMLTDSGGGDGEIFIFFVKTA